MTLGLVIKQTAFQAESIAEPGQWERVDYIKAIQKACVYAAILTGCTFRIAQETVSANSNLLTFDPVPLRVLTLRNPAMATILRSTDKATENGMDPGWRYKTGIPTRWMEEAGNTVRLNRIVEADTLLDVEILESPVALVNDADPIDPRFSDEIKNALCYAAAFFLLTQAGDHQDFQKAAACMQQFKDQIGVKETGHV